MTQQNLLELAKPGNSKAIACLLRPKLKSQGIAVKAEIKKDCLIVFLESDEVPDEQASVEFIKKEVEKLKVTFLHVVKVYARQQGEYHPTWIKEFEIAAPAQVEQPLPPGWSLRQANSKDRFKILKLLLLEKLKLLVEGESARHFLFFKGFLFFLAQWVTGTKDGWLGIL